MGEGLTTGTLVLSLQPLPRATNPSLSSHNSSPLCPLSSGAQGECLPMRYCVLSPQKDTCVSGRLLSLSGGQTFYVCLSLALILWAGEPSRRLSPHMPQGEPLQLRYPSRISVAACGSGPSPCCVSALSNSLYVASSVNLWL